MDLKPMNEVPKPAKDLKGNLEDFSKTVLIYDKGLDLWTLGWYNYDTNDWDHHMEESMEFIWWCYPPDPTEFISKNKLEKLKCKGFRD